MTQRRVLPNVVAAALCLGLAPLFTKAALNGGAAPLPLALATAAIGAALAGAYLWRQDGADSVTGMGRRTWAGIALVGALGSGLVVLLSVLAMTATTATNRSLFQAMYPVATALCARWFLGEELARSSYLLIVIICGGLFMMNTGAGGLEIGTPFWMLAATLPLVGLADVVAKRTLAEAPPRAVAAGRLAAGSLVLLLILPWTSAGDWRSVLVEGLPTAAAGACMAGGVLFLYRAMDATRASLAAALIALAPVVTVIAEWTLLDAAFTPTQLAGLALVVGGAALLGSRS